MRRFRVNRGSMEMGGRRRDYERGWDVERRREHGGGLGWDASRGKEGRGENGGGGGGGCWAGVGRLARGMGEDGMAKVEKEGGAKWQPPKGKGSGEGRVARTLTWAGS